MQSRTYHHSVIIMGCGYVITAVHSDAHVAWKGILAAEAEMRKIEKIFPSWKSDSQTAAINNAAGIKAVAVRAELYHLIDRSMKLSKMTNGAFELCRQTNHDITPSNGSKDFTNNEDILLDLSNHSVYLKRKGMQVDFRGICQGYATQRAKEVMLSYGVNDGLINASGDMLWWGAPTTEDSWEINISDPRSKAVNLFSLSLKEGAMVTLAYNEKQNSEDQTKRKSHMNSLSNPIKNVTVVCSCAEYANGIATSLSVLSIEEGLALCNDLEGVECIIIDAHDHVHFSNQLESKAYA